MKTPFFTIRSVLVLSSLALTVGMPKADAQNFILSSSPGVGLAPDCVVVADVNGDGKLDLISSDYGDNTLTVLTNNGDGTFTFSSTNTVGNNPIYIATADVNGDGKVDLLSANYSDSTLTVLTNNGDGTFTASSTNTVGNNLVFVTAADVNGDGEPDLITANPGDNNLAVLLNPTAPPVMKIRFANPNTALLSWLPTWPGYLLQQNTNLATTNWSTVSNPSGTNHVSISPATGKNFFRLRHP